MSGVRGADSSLLSKPETTYGVAATGNYDQLGFFSANLLPRRDLLPVRVLGIGTGRNPTDPMPGEASVEGEVTVPINEAGFGHWLRLLMGPPTTTGTSPNFTHVFASGAASLPSNTLVLDFGAPLGSERHLRTLGTRGNTMGIDFGTSGPATARIGLVAQDGALLSVPGGGTPAVAAGSVFNRVNGVITKGGSELALITEASLEFSNNIEALRTIRNDNKIAAAIPEDVTVGGRVTARFGSGGLQVEAMAGTPVDLVMGWEVSANRSILFRVQRAYLSQPSAPIEGPRGVQAQFDILASGQGVPAALTVTLKNGLAGTVYA